MSNPISQDLENSVDGLAGVSSSDIESMIAAALISFINGEPIDPQASTQELLDRARTLQCLSARSVRGIIVRRLLEILQLLDAFVSGGGSGSVLFGEGNPENSVSASQAIYVSTDVPGLYYQSSAVVTDVGWVQLL